MPDARASRWAPARLLLLAVTACVLAGCAGIPDTGGVHVGRPVPAAGGLGDVDLRFLPPAPVPGMAPNDIVHGFLRAMVNDDGNYEIARSYLTHRAAEAWNTRTGVTTYDESRLELIARTAPGSTRTVQLTAPRVGLVDARGDYTPGAGTVRATFQLARQDGQWRIDRLPPGVLMSTLDALRAFRIADVFYLNRSATTLVPEQVLVRPVPRSAPTALVRAMLSGPGRWLAPAVRTAFPQGTELVGNVPVNAGGTAEVNLSAAVRQASAAQLRALSAQLVWTLRQVSEINAVRLLADGAPVKVPGVGSTQPRTSWSGFDPAAPPVTPVAVYDDRGAWRVVGATLPGLSHSARGLSMLTLTRDGRRLAGVRAEADGASLVLGAVGHTPIARLHAATLTRPSFDRFGNAFVVATDGARRWVTEVDQAGAVHAVPADPALLDGPVQQLVMSRDGARVAAVVGRSGHGRLVVGRVTTVRGALRLDAFRNILPAASDIRGVAWDGSDQLVVTAADAAGGRELITVDVDGYSTRTVPTTGLDADPTDVAAAPGHPLVVSAGGEIWRDTPTGVWSRVGRGLAPAYP